MARKQRTVYNDYDRDQVKVILKKMNVSLTIR